MISLDLTRLVDINCAVLQLDIVLQSEFEECDKTRQVSSVAGNGSFSSAFVATKDEDAAEASASDRVRVGSGEEGSVTKLDEDSTADVSHAEGER